MKFKIIDLSIRFYEEYNHFQFWFSLLTWQQNIYRVLFDKETSFNQPTNQSTNIRKIYTPNSKNTWLIFITRTSFWNFSIVRTRGTTRFLTSLANRFKHVSCLHRYWRYVKRFSQEVKTIFWSSSKPQRYRWCSSLDCTEKKTILSFHRQVDSRRTIETPVSSPSQPLPCRPSFAKGKEKHKLDYAREKLPR